METKNAVLPFFGVEFYWKPEGKLGQRIYRKTTSIGTYLHETFDHHPTQEKSTIHALTKRAYQISNKNHVKVDLQKLKSRSIFKANDYWKRMIKKTMARNHTNKKKLPRKWIKFFVNWASNYLSQQQ